MLQTLALLGIAAGAPVPLSAQVPQLIHYQGQVTVEEIVFDGPGFFRFALVDATGATTYWSNDNTSTAGSMPINAVELTVRGGLYSVLLGDASLPHMTSVPATVFENEEVFLRVWFDDGVHGVQQLTPDQRIAAVGYAMMAAGVPAQSITSGNLAPDAVTSEKIAPGAVGVEALAPDAVAGGLAGIGGVVLTKDHNEELEEAGYIKLGSFVTDDGWADLPVGSPLGSSPRSDHTAVWTGTQMLLWGGLDEEGGRGWRYDPSAGTWAPMALVNAPSPRRSHSAVWTGSEMLVWGGIVDFDETGDGARYDPLTDTWTPISSINAPSARHLHSAVWTGTEMVIWGGGEFFGPAANSGARYDPVSDSWSPLSTVNAPTARFRQSGVWTGSEMLIWGGYNDGFGAQSNGARYDPTTDTWAALPFSGAPDARFDHYAFWTGTEMLIWGGEDGAQYRNDGGRYDPDTNTWLPLPTTQAPTPRIQTGAVWTGDEMVVWGGLEENSSTYVNDGARYSPTTNTWTPLATNGAPYRRSRHSAVWTGAEVIVWGGSLAGFGQKSMSGSRYNPATDSWIPIKGGESPRPRYQHTAIWTGTEVIVWGGQSPIDYYNDGGRYNPATGTWRELSTVNAPSPRIDHTAVWTGSEMIIWGGAAEEIGGSMDSGGRYDPVSDTWTPISTGRGTPEARRNHVAVWSGTHMLIWGGAGNSSYAAGGGRYDPDTDGWSLISTTGAPEARRNASAVWTGTEMIVWGGNNPSALNTGGRYNPESNIWVSVTLYEAPERRLDHQAVWTGSEMLVWGGINNTILNYPLAGGRYDPATDDWSAMTASGSPEGRTRFTAVWTGREMIVWGGRDSDWDALATGGRYDPIRDRWEPTSDLLAPPVREYHSAVWTGTRMIIFGGTAFSDTNVYPGGGSYDPGSQLFIYCQP